MEKKKKKGWKKALIIVGVVLLVIVLAVFIVVKSYLNRIGRVDDGPVTTIPPKDEYFEVDVTPSPSPTATAEPTVEPTRDPNVLDIDPDDVEWPFIEALEDDDLINILLVGQDKYPGQNYQGRMHSDTMILCSINPETGEVAMISFLRDLYVEIPGDYSDNRLNAPYVFGGFDLLDETLALNFGVSIDANFEVDMAGFEAIINMVDGVDVELTEAEAKYLRAKWECDVSAGMNHLDGETARHFAQIRAIDSDFNRTGRQREILLAVLDKVKHLPVNELLALMYDALPYVTTDLTDGQILSLAYRLLPLVASIKVETHYVPHMDCYTLAYIRGMQVLVPDRELIRARLEEWLPLS